MLRFCDELIARIGWAGATGPKLLRADSGFWNHKTFAKLDRAGWEFSIGVRLGPAVRRAIELIDEAAWTTLEGYPPTSIAQIAETVLGDRRVVVRRVRTLSQQGELLPSWEHFAFATNCTAPLGAVESEHRQHAVVELAIRDLRLVSVLGNLTLVTGELNSALSNAPWTIKRQRLQKSVLLLNGEVKSASEWDEQAILRRGAQLAGRIAARWPAPEAMIPGFDPSLLTSVVAEVDAEQAVLGEDQWHKVTAGISDLMRLLLSDLAAHPDQRRRYVEVEDSLGWSRGRLASVLGGYGVFANAHVAGKRPFRIGKDEDGEYWMWMDAARAAAVVQDVTTR